MRRWEYRLTLQSDISIYNNTLEEMCPKPSHLITLWHR